MAQTATWFLLRSGRPSTTGGPSARTDSTEGPPEPVATISTVYAVRRVRATANPHVVIGRLRSSDIVLPDQGVSSVHAYLLIAGAEVRVWDAGSRNGTRLDDQRVPGLGEGPGLVLAPGGWLRFGRVVTQIVGHAGLLGAIERAGAP